MMDPATGVYPPSDLSTFFTSSAIDAGNANATAYEQQALKYVHLVVCSEPYCDCRALKFCKEQGYIAAGVPTRSFQSRMLW